MIRIRRKSTAPDTLKSQKVKDAQKKIEGIAAQRKPASKDFQSHWGEDDVRTALWEMQHRKCCYCERKRDKNRESDIEHFRPKADVTEADEAHKGYWWLAYEWPNLFFSCRHCNQEHKKNHFPVANQHAVGPTDSLLAEGALLIDPTVQDPEDCLSYDWSIKDKKGKDLVFVVPRGDTAEGWTTKNVLGLNQGTLPTDRGEIIVTLQALAGKMRTGIYMLQEMLDERGARLIEAAAQQIKEETSASEHSPASAATSSASRTSGSTSHPTRNTHRSASSSGINRQQDLNIPIGLPYKA